jgi:ELWxxDGT repeat protein
LLKTDGTRQGTQTVADGLTITLMASIGDILFFAANDGFHGEELWMSDGTPEHTILFRDLNPGIAGSNIKQMTTDGGSLLVTTELPPYSGHTQAWTFNSPFATAGNSYTVAIGSSVTLDASASLDAKPNEALTFAWDLDGDGRFGETGADAARGDETGPTPVFSTRDLPTGSYTVTVRVTNSAGVSSTADATINIRSTNLSGTDGPDRYTIRLTPDGNELEIFEYLARRPVYPEPGYNDPFYWITPDTPTTQLRIPASLPGGSIISVAARDHFYLNSLTIDCSNGNPLASNILQIDSGTVVPFYNDSRRVLRLGGLSIADGAKLELGSGGLIITATPATRYSVQTTIANYVKRTRTPDGRWEGKGLTSYSTSDFAGLIAVLNDRGNGKPILTKYDGQSVGTNDILVKYTWNGDVNLDGVIDAADYFMVDSGFLTQQGGYQNGDLNYDGQVDAADYFLIDSAFLAQNATLGQSAPTPTDLTPQDSIRQAPLSEPFASADQATQVRGLSGNSVLFATGRPIAMRDGLAFLAGKLARPGVVSALFGMPAELL